MNADDDADGVVRACIYAPDENSSENNLGDKLLYEEDGKLINLIISALETENAGSMSCRYEANSNGEGKEYHVYILMGAAVDKNPSDTQASKSISLSIAIAERNYKDNEVKLEISVNGFTNDIEKLSGIKFMISYPRNFKITDKKDEGYFGTQAYSISGEDGANPMIFALGCDTDDTTKTEAVTIKSGKLLTITLKANRELIKGKRYEFKLLDNVANGDTDIKSEAFLLETIGAGSEYPVVNTTYFRVKSQTTVAKYVPIKSRGGEDTTVSGSIVSRDNVNNAVVRLYEDSSELTDKVIRADMRTDTRSKAVSGMTVVLDDKLEAGTKTGTYTQSFTLSAELEDGTYKLAVYKPKKDDKNPYVVSVVKVTVSSGIATIDGGSNVKMWLYGDVNDDGSVDAKDAGQASRYGVGLSSLVKVNHDSVEESHRYIAADINGDGSVDAKDAGQMSRRGVGLSSLLDNLRN